MRFRQLDERTYAGDEAAETLGKAGALAKKALGAFHTAKEKAKSDVKGDLIDAVKDNEDAEKEAAKTSKGDKEGTKADAGNVRKSARQIRDGARRPGVAAPPKSLYNMLANFLLAAHDPDTTDMPEVEALDGEAIAKMERIVKAAIKNCANAPAILRKTLRTNYLNAQDRRPESLDAIMQELSDTDAIEETFFSRNGPSQHLTDMVNFMILNTPQSTARAMLTWLRTESKKNEAKNNSGAGNYPVGARLAAVLRGIIQIVDRRVHGMNTALQELENQKDSTPPTDDTSAAQATPPPAPGSEMQIGTAARDAKIAARSQRRANEDLKMDESLHALRTILKTL